MNDVKERSILSDAIRVPCDDGGGRRDRTDDLLLAKQALSQLSYAPGIRRGRDPGVVRPARTGLTLRKSRSRESWWAREDLNLRPHAYQARALTS